MKPLSFRSPLVLALVLGCETKAPEDDSGDDPFVDGNPQADADTDADTDADADADTDADLTAEDMPNDPGSFIVSLSDGTTLAFDSPSCNHYRGSSNFRMFWRNEARAHVYVMTMEAMGMFTEAGSYSSDEGTVRVKFQEEAGGSGAPPFMTDSNQGDQVTLTVAYIDENVAWGETTLTGIHDALAGTPVTITPTTLPIWCPDVEI